MNLSVTSKSISNDIKGYEASSSFSNRFAGFSSRISNEITHLSHTVISHEQYIKEMHAVVSWGGGSVCEELDMGHDNLALIPGTLEWGCAFVTSPQEAEAGRSLGICLIFRVGSRELLTFTSSPPRWEP